MIYLSLIPEDTILKKLCFIFPGYGAAHTGFGKGVADADPRAEAVFEKGTKALGFDTKEMALKGKANDVQGEEYTFQLQVLDEVALVESAKDILPAPEAFIGYSAGEITALCAGGVFSVEDAMTAAVAYRDMRKEAVGAGMLYAYRLRNVKHEFVSLASDKCISGFVQMTAVEAPEQTVLIGDEEGTKAVLTELAKHKVKQVRLKDTLALHSMMVFPYVAKLQDAIRPLAHTDLSINLYSTLYGKKCDKVTLPSDYFAKQQVNAIRFYEAAKAAVNDGIEGFVIIGKDRDLLSAAKNIAGDGNVFMAETVEDLRKIAAKIAE